MAVYSSKCLWVYIEVEQEGPQSTSSGSDVNIRVEMLFKKVFNNFDKRPIHMVLNELTRLQLYRNMYLYTD